jgi:spermidine/putrescine transport system substrate-binding protein
MTRRDDKTRILISRPAADRLINELSRRRFLAMTGGAAAAALLAACGSDDSGDSGGTSPAGGSAGTSPSGTTGGGGDFDKTINMYTWAEYDDPDLLKSWGTINLTIFNSNEEAIQKLVQGGGSSGFDMVVPTGPYIPQMASEGLLLQLDHSRIPNFANLDPLYTNQVWDQGNQFSVCKNWGTTGWIYDTTVVKRDITSWADFLDVAMNEASGQISVLDTAPNLCGIYFWAHDLDWNTEDEAELDACDDYLVNQFAQHIKAFDSYPGINLTQGNYVLSQVWNGDARQGLLGVEEAGDDVSQYKWGLGAPQTELWMDNWCILDGAKNVDAAYDFVNFILDPQNSVTDLNFHGYNTGIKGVEDLAADAEYKDMIFFTPDQVETMKSQVLNSSQERKVQIYSDVKVKAGG